MRSTRDRIRHAILFEVVGLALIIPLGTMLFGLHASDMGVIGIGSAREDHVKIAVLSGSLVAALLASVVLLARNRTYRRIHAEEQVDENRDNIPDVYQRPQESS